MNGQLYYIIGVKMKLQSKKLHKRAKNLANTKINMLYVVDFAGYYLNSNNTSIQAYWNCICECGLSKKIDAHHLNAKTTKSCGCFKQRNLNRISGPNNSRWKGYKDISLAYWSRIVQRAKKRDLEINITIEYIWDLFIQQNQKCALTNLDIILNTTYKSMRNGLCTASLDRIDNTKGYTIGNVQWVHKDINWMKNDMTQKEFINLCKLVSEKFK